MYVKLLIIIIYIYIYMYKTVGSIGVNPPEKQEREVVWSVTKPKLIDKYKLGEFDNIS